MRASYSSKAPNDNFTCLRMHKILVVGLLLLLTAYFASGVRFGDLGPRGGNAATVVLLLLYLISGIAINETIPILC